MRSGPRAAPRSLDLTEAAARGRRDPPRRPAGAPAGGKGAGGKGALGKGGGALSKAVSAVNLEISSNANGRRGFPGLPGLRSFCGVLLPRLFKSCGLLCIP